MTLLEPGTLFAGYRVIRQLGAGGMGQVYLVEHPSLHRHEALKIVSTGTDDPDFLARFTNEARMAASLDHPGIVTVYAHGIENRTPWFTMTYLQGHDLDHHPPLPIDDTLHITTRVADALDYAHARRIIHRDIKPANIVITTDPHGHPDRVTVLDFGIARLIDAPKMTATSAFIGTLAYAAPEILNGAPATPASDQYALACTTFTLLTGTPPFPATNPGHLISGHLHAPIPRLSERIPTPPAADAVIARAMAKNPTDRYPTCHDFTTDLHRAMSSRGAPTLIPGAVPMPPQHPGAPGTGLTPATPAPPAPTSPRGSSARRTALLVTAAVSVLLLVAAVAGVAVWLSAGDEPSTPPAAASGTGAPAATSAPDASGDWTAVSTSTTVSCGIKGRALLCWGDNDYGAVGDGTTTDRTVPTAVTGISDVSSVSVAFGQARVCAVSKGDLYCWGQDLAGGDMQRIPTRVDGISDVSGVSSGIATCVVRRGEVYCWGNNVYGSAGVGTTSTSVADPTKVAGLENVASITSGVATTCAITRGAELYCWGQNNTGQVGDGTRENRATPVKIPGLRSVTSVSPGTSNTCAVAEGQVYCWGYGPGQYPSGTENEHLRPEPIGLDGARYVANTGTGGCAAVVSGHVSCWRSGGDVAPTPADVAGIDQVTALDGNINVCAISAGRLYCWGLNNAGQLGDGTTTTSIDQPVRVRDPA